MRDFLQMILHPIHAILAIGLNICNAILAMCLYYRYNGFQKISLSDPMELADMGLNIGDPSEYACYLP